VRTYRRKKLLDPDRRMAVAVRLRAEGLSLRQIAAQQGVCHQTVALDLAYADESGLGPVRDKVISSNHVRRARRAGVAWEYISLAAVAARDAWLCGICGKPVPEKWRQEDRRLMPSLDHIVPIEHGGAHLDSNVQLAHFFCNLSKGPGKREPHRVQALTFASFTAAARKVLTVADVLDGLGDEAAL
jgi:5-methylcytosine-specific restriction endonuclease McrA